MPELPEVETTRRGIAPWLKGRVVKRVIIRDPRLRWPVPPDLPQTLEGRRVLEVDRRAKYLLVQMSNGTLILHLGMSGSLRVNPADVPPGAHDHLDLVLDDGNCLRLRDPRRFGAALWTSGDPRRHRLLCLLGPEPLSAAFNGEHLRQLAVSRTLAVKNFIMDSRVVVGVGNIYANEALFSAGIHPQRACNRVSLARYRRLATAIKTVLEQAIARGGTTLRDFVNEGGRPGYFGQELQVYGRSGQPCIHCGARLRKIILGQRSSFYCPRCQT
jgi:formamidopyrimidine-DNA glycosylase